jgi:hypothetical protein
VCQVAVASNSSDPVGTLTMEMVVQRENLCRALKRVCSNKGGPGIDGMVVDALPDYLKANWLSIRTQLLQGYYEPQPVKQVLIPKPGGGARKLGIPTVLDRFIQQALLQVLSPAYDPGFSPHRDAQYTSGSGQLDPASSALFYDETLDQKLSHSVPSPTVLVGKRIF